MSNHKELYIKNRPVLASTPSNPETGFVKLYIKAGIWYWLDDAGIERRIHPGVMEGEVDTFANLPDPTTVPGQLWETRITTGSIWLRNQKKAGTWYSDGTQWTAPPQNTATVNDLGFQLYDPSRIYSVGNTVTHIGRIYIANTAVLTPELFDENKWSEVALTEDVLNQIENRIVVKQASDFNGVIDSSKQYFLDGLIDMGSTELTVIGDGFIRGLDYFLSGLYSTADNYTMFKNATGQTISNLRMGELNFWVSGVNSKVFDLEGDGTGAVEFNSCNLGDFAGSTTSLGQLTAFRQFRTNDAGYFLLRDGLTFNGTWSGGFRIGDSISLATIGTMTIFKEGTNLTFGGRCFSDGNFGSLNDTTTVFDFQESNFLLDGSFQLNKAFFNRNAPAIPNISSSSTKVFFRDCVGVDNTGVRTLIRSTTQVTNTLTFQVEEKVEGQTEVVYSTWMSSNVDNRITVDTNEEIDLEVSYKGRIDGGPNDEIAISIYFWDDSEGTFTQVVREVETISNSIGGFDVVDFDIDGVVKNATSGDYFEPRIENTSDNTDVRVLVGAKLKAVRI